REVFGVPAWLVRPQRSNIRWDERQSLTMICLRKNEGQTPFPPGNWLSLHWRAGGKCCLLGWAGGDGFPAHQKTNENRRSASFIFSGLRRTSKVSPSL